MMYYLVDTNVFLHAINESVYSVAQLCKDIVFRRVDEHIIAQ